MTSRAWQAYLLLGAVAVAGYLLVPIGVARDVLYVLVGLSSATGILLAVRLHRPVRRAPWYAMASGQLLWTAGDATYGWLDHVQHVEPFPSLADAFYLTAYACFGLAFLLLLRGRQAGRDREGLLDSTIFTIGLALISWVCVLEPTISASDSTTLERVVGLAYPLGDVLLFGLLARLLTTPGGRTPAFRLLLASGGLLFAADTTFALLTLVSDYSGGLLDLLWLSAYVLSATAALHPSMRSLSEPVADAPAALSGRRLLALTAAGLIPPGTLAVQLLLSVALDAWAVVLSSIALFLLVIARMSGLLSRVQTQAGLLDALSRTDALTGLPNRRSADAELGRALARVAQTGEALSVAMVDLDRFKDFNDVFGHQAGDRLLVQAAAHWGRELRGQAVLARYGGEEFLLVGVGLDLEPAEQLLGLLRRVTPAGQTFSAGLAGWDGLESVEGLVHRADNALYAAKRDGRDRVVVAQRRPVVPAQTVVA